MDEQKQPAAAGPVERGVSRRHQPCEKCGTRAMCSRLGCADKWPTPGSRWTDAKWPNGAVAVVLDTVQGWVVWRRKGAMPQLRHVNQWHDVFKPAEPIKRKRPANVMVSGPL